MTNRRGQRIRYEPAGIRGRFETTVAAAALVAMRGRDAVAHDHLQRNRATPIAAFGFDARHRLISWAEDSAATLQPVEVALILAAPARAADRLEWPLTARDVH